MCAFGTEDKVFDMRFAAVQSLYYFFTALPPSSPVTTSLSSLPALLALYDALNDDDTEIRELAALAATPIIGTSIASIEAATQLLSFLGATFGAESEMIEHIAERITGCTALELPLVPLQGVERVIGANWAPASTQLRDALPTDLSLFVVEKQNLFLDEVRETYRWADIMCQLSLPADNPVAVKLYVWAQEGLEALIQAMEEKGEDGPLGWTSKPLVFAVCTRILVGAAVVANSIANGKQKREESQECIRKKLEHFKSIAVKSGFHEALVRMADMYQHRS